MACQSFSVSVRNLNAAPGGQDYSHCVYLTLRISVESILTEHKLNKSIVRTSVILLGALFFSRFAVAGDGMKVKWTEDVGATIKLISVDAEKQKGGYRIVKYTFEALKPCGRLSVYGHNFSKDEVQLGEVGLGPTLTNVKPGQKYQHRDVVAAEPGHYLVLDRVMCF